MKPSRSPAGPDLPPPLIRIRRVLALGISRSFLFDQNERRLARGQTPLLLRVGRLVMVDPAVLKVALPGPAKEPPSAQRKKELAAAKPRHRRGRRGAIIPDDVAQASAPT